MSDALQPVEAAKEDRHDPAQAGIFAVVLVAWSIKDSARLWAICWGHTSLSPITLPKSQLNDVQSRKGRLLGVFLHVVVQDHI
jgi:hypothetical protein